MLSAKITMISSVRFFLFFRAILQSYVEHFLVIFISMAWATVFLGEKYSSWNETCYPRRLGYITFTHYIMRYKLKHGKYIL